MQKDYDYILMNDMVRWFLQNAGAGLIACALLCLFLAFLLLVQAYRAARSKRDGNDVSALPESVQRLMLNCGDAKALVNLAIQRHMEDAEFLRHLRLLPCYEELVPYFSDTLKAKIAAAPADQGTRPTLAVACLEDIARLEREFFGAANTKSLFPG